MIKYTALAAMMVALAGCQSPANVKDLQANNTRLQASLASAKQEIAVLNGEKNKLQQDVVELNRVMDVLGVEKASRVTESSSLRAHVRSFVQDQIDGLKDFMVMGDLLDYVGGELVARTSLDEEPLMIVDLTHPMPRDGILTGVGGFWNQPGVIKVKVLRPLEDRLLVVWASKALRVASKERNTVSFPVNVGVEKGDVMAYYLQYPGSVSYDAGTGDARYLSDDLMIGSKVHLKDLKGAKERRAYSLGVYGLLNR